MDKEIDLNKRALMVAIGQVRKKNQPPALSAVGWKRSLLVDVDEEGIDIRNLSCTQIGLRELLYCEGVTQIAQVMAAPLGLALEKRGHGFWRLRTSRIPTWTSRELKLNRGWRLIGHSTSAATAVPEILGRVADGHPVLVCPASLLLSYYPADKDPLHTAIAAQLEGDELLIYDDMQLPSLIDKTTRVPLSHLRCTPESQLVHWFHIAQVETTASWEEELAAILAASTQGWCGSADAGTGLHGLKAFLVWFRSWDVDLTEQGDIDRLTALFLSMRFEMSSSHHLLAVAMDHTPGVPSAGRAAEALAEICMSWNGIIIHLFAWKEAKQVKHRSTLDGMIAGLIDREAKLVRLLEACHRELLSSM